MRGILTLGVFDLRQFLVPFALSLAGLVAGPAVHAQERDSVFVDYDAYADFVDSHIMTRDFIPLIQTLGGRDEYTIEQLQGIRNQLLGAWPNDFTGKSVFRQEDLGGGIRQEGRVYWTGEYYAYYYAVLHERDDELVVINFYLNTSITEIMARF